MLPSAELVGWWIGGRQPGDPTGAAVLAGHLDDDQGRVGALATIGSLRRNDPLIVRTMTGTVHYHVVSVQTYSKTQLPRSLFAAAGPARLVLITCGGDYTPGQGYADNVVVTALPQAGSADAEG
jgi:sortase (surface protein transpeptidase)